MKKSKVPEIPKEVEELANDLSGGYWNARVVKKHVNGKYENGEEYDETYMGIFEVYYKANDEIWAWSENEIPMNFNGKEEFGEVINQYFNAAQRPVLEEIDGKLVETDEVILPEEMMKKEKKKNVK